MTSSKQYSFINNTHGFSISFIEGHNAMSELTKIHNIGPYALDFYNKTLLSSLQMINFIKPDEQLGFYIDSEEPYYRFKIEINPNGKFRTLLLPEDFDDFPKVLTGKCRISKMYPRKPAYMSVLDFENHELDDLVNEVMNKSYQTNSTIKISKDQHNSLMISKLPPANVNSKIEDFEDLNLLKIQEKFEPLFNKLLNLSNAQLAEVESILKEGDFHYLGAKEINFHCPCSKEKMVNNLFTLNQKDREDIFSDRSTIEIRCDYCNSIYDVSKSDLDQLKIQ